MTWRQPFYFGNPCWPLHWNFHPSADIFILLIVIIFFLTQLHRTFMVMTSLCTVAAFIIIFIHVGEFFKPNEVCLLGPDFCFLFNFFVLIFIFILFIFFFFWGGGEISSLWWNLCTVTTSLLFPYKCSSTYLTRYVFLLLNKLLWQVFITKA